MICGSRLGESNPRPTHYECVALPTELRRRAAAKRQRRESTGRAYPVRPAMASSAHRTSPGGSAGRPASRAGQPRP